jgi:hypothetical protein
MPIRFIIMVAPLFALHHFAFYWEKKYPRLSNFFALAGALWYSGLVFLVNGDKSLLMAFLFWCVGIIPLLLVLRYRIFTQQRPLTAGRFFYFLVLMLQTIIIYVSVKF